MLTKEELINLTKSKELELIIENTAIKGTLVQGEKSFSFVYPTESKFSEGITSHLIYPFEHHDSAEKSSFKEGYIERKDKSLVLRNASTSLIPYHTVFQRANYTNYETSLREAGFSVTRPITLQ